MAIGDQLFVKYVWGEHHGIDLGDGTVIEYAGKGSSFKSVRRALLREFLARGPALVKRYAPGTAVPPDETVRRAFSRLGERRYDLFSNNCEHFAYWCKTGSHRSSQVESIKGAIPFVALLFLLPVLLDAA
jgi:hypothetical protein